MRTESGKLCLLSSPCSFAHAWIITNPPSAVMRSSSRMTAERRSDDGDERAVREMTGKINDENSD